MMTQYETHLKQQTKFALFHQNCLNKDIVITQLLLLLFLLLFLQIELSKSFLKEYMKKKQDQRRVY